MRTRKSFSKRIKKNRNHYFRKQANKGHLLGKKRPNRKRYLSRNCTLNITQQKLAIRVMFF